MNLLVSPDDLHKAAWSQMLGHEPITHEDWMLCVNFWAANIKNGLEVSAVLLLGIIYDCPLTRKELVQIAEFQHSKKEG